MDIVNLFLRVADLLLFNLDLDLISVLLLQEVIKERSIESAVALDHHFCRHCSLELIAVLSGA